MDLITYDEFAMIMECENNGGYMPLNSDRSDPTKYELEKMVGYVSANA